MEYEAEDPTGYLSMWCLLVFYLGNLGYAPCERNTFLSGWSPLTPLDTARVPGLIGQRVDRGHCGIEWEASEIEVDLGRKNPAVALAYFLKDR